MTGDTGPLTGTVPSSEPVAANGSRQGEAGTLLELRQLCVNYGTPSMAVDHLDLVVRKQETVALLGANGAGKTSTLGAISGLVPWAGEIVFDGASLRGTSPEKIARAGVVQVPEGRRLFAALSVEENLLVGTTARTKREPIFKLADIYDLFPQLQDLRRRGAWSLSGGEQQMVAIGRGLLSAPRLLLLDEPSLGLAPIIVRAVYDALRSITQRVAVLLVEQNAGLALDLCDRAYILTTGRVVLTGTPAELPNREELLATYLAE